MRIHSCTGMIFLLLLLVGKEFQNPIPGKESEKSESLSADDIYARMREVYSRCDSYRDKGKCTTTRKNIIDPYPWITETEFSTVFLKKPKRFRLEFLVDHHRVVIIQGKKVEPTSEIVFFDGKKVRMSRAWERKKTSLSDALENRRLFSEGVTTRIPNLIYPKWRGFWSKLNLKKLERLEDAEWKKNPCFRLWGENRLDFKVELWIDRKTFLIRRMLEKQSSKTGETLVLETDFEPELNPAIDPKAVSFK